ncbi:MAG: hypothetical protein AMXMBFR58_36360 [Phycisphaerae bacterium]|nr:hypothetical protein [Phycisphaerales bacterium]
MHASPLTVFVGSSTEGLPIAEALQRGLEAVAEVTIWSQSVFALSKTSVESLEAALQKFDFAVLALSGDDVVSSRGETSQSPRDNVLLELGLFMGSLGRNRAFFVYDRTANLKVPTDLLGVTAATYKPHADGNLDAALGPTCASIKASLRQVGPRPKLMRFTSAHEAGSFPGPSIAGEWTGFSPEGNEPGAPTSKMMIEQYGSFVKAKVDRATKNGKRVFEYEGRLTAGQLVLFFEDVSGRGYIVGTMVLSLSGDLNRLEGRSTYFDHSDHVVKSSARRYLRGASPPLA